MANPAAFAQVDASSLNNLVTSLSTVVDAAALSSADEKKLVALVQSHQESGADGDDIGAPAAAVCKTHITNILDVLEDSKDKAEDQLSDLRKAETNTRQSLEDQIAADAKDLGEEKAAKAAAEESKAGAEGELAGTLKDLADAKAALAMTNSDCVQTAADHADGRCPY
jgi:hypothetical protein